MNYEEVERLLKRLSQKHHVPMPQWTIYDEYHVPMEKERGIEGGFVEELALIEFYGEPTEDTVIHEFFHYLDFVRRKCLGF